MKIKIKGTIGANKVNLQLEWKLEDMLDEYITSFPSMATKLAKAKPMVEKLMTELMS